MTSSRYSLLFEPLAIGPKLAPNRFYGLPYGLGPALDNDPDAAAAHQGMRAAGGWGVVCCGECTFSVDGGGHGMTIGSDSE